MSTQKISIDRSIEEEIEGLTRPKAVAPALTTEKMEQRLAYYEAAAQDPACTIILTEWFTSAPTWFLNELQSILHSRGRHVRERHWRIADDVLCCFSAVTPPKST